MSFCFPSHCNCCVCRNIHCLFYHPGHDHRQHNENGIWFKGIYIPFDRKAKNEREAESDGGEGNNPPLPRRE